MPRLKNLCGKLLCINIDWILKFDILIPYSGNAESVRSQGGILTVISGVKAEIKTDSLRQEELHCIRIIVTNCK